MRPLLSKTALAKENANYQRWTRRLNIENAKKTKLINQASNLVNQQNQKVIAEQKAAPAVLKTIIKKGKKTIIKTHNVSGMTNAQKKAYLAQTKVGKALKIVRKRTKRYAKKRTKYLGTKQDTINYHRSNTLAKAKSTVQYTSTVNSYIMPNNAHTNSSFIAFMVTSEADDNSLNVASEPIEHGVNVVTGTQLNTPSISVTASIYGSSFHQVKEQVNRLVGWSQSGADMYFSGPHQHSHCVISDITPTFNWGPDGSLTTADISMTLTIANYFDTTVKYKQRGKAKNKGAKSRKRGRSSNIKNASHYVIAKSGMTYWYVAVKKHVSVQSVEQKNSYAATKIPIGSKIYY